MNSIMQKFGTQTSLHGFFELFFAKSVISRIFWITILLIATTMTVYHIDKVITNFVGNPTKTQITFLPHDVPVEYPPYIFCYKHFVDWLDLEKAKIYQLDYPTLVYAMSYFYPVYTHRIFDVQVSNENLKIIMKKFNFTDIYDFAVSLSYDLPTNIVSNESFHRFIDTKGQFYYIAKMDATFYKDRGFLQYTSKFITMKSYATFQQTKFYKEFGNFSGEPFDEEYRYFKVSVLKDSADNYSMTSLMPIKFNSIGEKNAFGDIDIFLNSYEFYVTGSLYNWIPLPEKKCEFKKQTFFADCMMNCSQRYKLVRMTSCSLHFVEKSNISYEELIKLNQSCEFDKSLFGPNFSDDSNIQNYEDCVADCMNSCTKWNFQFHQVLYPNRISTEHSRKVIGSITMTYDEKESILVVSLLPSVTWDEAVANIGGLLGLWLGGSIISFIQVMYIFCWIPVETWLKHGRIVYESRRIKSERNRQTVNSTSTMQTYLPPDRPGLFYNVNSSLVSTIADSVNVERIRSGSEVTNVSSSSSTDIAETFQREVDEIKYSIHRLDDALMRLRKSGKDKRVQERQQSY